MTTTETHEPVKSAVIIGLKDGVQVSAERSSR